MSNKLPGTLKMIYKGMFCVLLLAFTSCARKISFGHSSVVPAAEGRIKIKKDQNNNNQIDIEIKNLAKAEQLVPSRNTYVVWMETDGNGIKNIGQLNSSSGMFSKALKASLTTVTTFKPTRFFITAEDNATIQFPGSQVVLSTERL
jgi:hypothetical protein